MLITWFQMLKLMFQQRQCDAIEAASQGLIPILNSNFQNRRSGINFMTFGPLIQMPLAQRGKRQSNLPKGACLFFCFRKRELGIPQRELLSFHSNQAQRKDSVVGLFPMYQMFNTLQRQLSLSYFMSFPRELSGRNTWTLTPRVSRDWTTRKPEAWWGADEQAAL